MELSKIKYFMEVNEIDLNYIHNYKLFLYTICNIPYRHMFLVPSKKPIALTSIWSYSVNSFSDIL